MIGDGERLTALRFGDHPGKERACPVLEQTEKWLDLYFAGIIPDFTPPLAAAGTPFQKRVWERLLAIPYGQTVTYGQLAAEISPRMAAQAVGGAVGRNPIAIIVPCHRVIGARGALVGYEYGTDIKQKLLQMEKRQG